jgi:hypothetical protein
VMRSMVLTKFRRVVSSRRLPILACISALEFGADGATVLIVVGSRAGAVGDVSLGFSDGKVTGASVGERESRDISWVAMELCIGDQ